MPSEEITMTDSQTFVEGMSRLAAGVSLVTTIGEDGAPLGMLATAVTSVSADPPTLLVCVNQSATMHADLIRSGTFCVNVLGEANAEIARRFSSGTDRAARFATGDWRRVGRGAPVLADSLVSFNCRIETTVQGGTHTVVIGRVVDLATPPVTGGPLVYFGRGYLHG